MKRIVLPVFLLILIIVAGYSMTASAGDDGGQPDVWVPLDSQGGVITPSVPVVPSVPERQVEPGILDDNAKFNTTVPEDAFGGQGTDQEEHRSWDENRDYFAHAKNQKLLSFYLIQSDYYGAAIKFRDEALNSKGLDALEYYPSNPSGKAVLWKSDMLKMVDDRAKDDVQRGHLHDFALEVNAQLDNYYLFPHVVDELIGAKINEGGFYFYKSDSREQAKRDLINNGLLLAQFEGLGLKDTYRYLLSAIMLFDVKVYVSWDNTGQHVKAESYLKKAKGDAYTEKELTEIDEVIQKLGLKFPSVGQELVYDHLMPKNQK